MIKVYVKKLNSKKAKGVLYSGKIDAFKVADVAEYKRKHEGKVSEVQRKKQKKHEAGIVVDVKKEKRLFAWTFMLSINGDMELHEEKLYNAAGEYVLTEYYILWPETEAEMEAHAKDIEIIDGQHRCAALSKINGLKKILGSYEIAITVLDHPDGIEVRRQFRASNGKGKPMSKELLFQYSAEIGDLDKDVAAARSLLVEANNEPTNPLYKKIKFGEGRGTYGANTIVNRWVNPSFNLIQEMRDAGLKTKGEQFQMLDRMMKVVDTVNKINDAKTKEADKNCKLQSISATKYGKLIADIAPTVLQLPKIEGKRRTDANIADVYCTLINDVLLVDNVRDSGNETISYTFENLNVTRTVKDRYNGNAKVNTATVDTIEALKAARMHCLKAKKNTKEAV